MSATTLRPDGESTPGSDTGERITRLFPKCRPRVMHQQHDRLSSVVDSRNNDINNVNNMSSDEDLRDGTDNQVVILNSKGGSYKLRDSRIIEIAGGRELYSQSRAKAVRKLRHSSTHKYNNLRNKVRSLNKDTVDFITDNINHEISLNRLKNEPKKMISRHTSPTYTNGDRDSNILDNNMGIPRNSSPILDPHKTNDISAKSSPIAVVADGEVMVFDDNEDWKVILNSVSLGLRLDADASDNEIDISVKRTLDNLKNGCFDSDLVNNRDGDISDGSESSRSGEEGRGSGGSGGVKEEEEEDEKSRVTRVIGELPIAEYEGSPRRYGVGSQLTNHSRSPRPGFPQRVITESRDVTPPSGSAAFDYLYEFSETRKVLEEFFRCPAGGGQTQLPSMITDEIINFQELDYSLRRQPAEGAGAVEGEGEGEREGAADGEAEEEGEGADEGVGERAGGAEAEAEWARRELLSPHEPHNHTNFLGLQPHHEHYPEPNVAELTVGAAWSGSGSPEGQRARARARERVRGEGAGAAGAATAAGRGRPRAFALSPDTSDCDSHCDLDSDLSLMLMENELHEMKGLAESARAGGVALGAVSMPLVEDGLSSAHSSDRDYSRTDRAQTHTTSVIIEEVVENGTSIEPHVLSDADLHSLDPLACSEVSPPPPAPAPHRPPDEFPLAPLAPLAPLQTPAPVYHNRKRPTSAQSTESVEVKPTSGDEDEADTDLETDRLLGQQRTDDQGFFDDKVGFILSINFSPTLLSYGQYND